MHVTQTSRKHHETGHFCDVMWLQPQLKFLFASILSFLSPNKFPFLTKFELVVAILRHKLSLIVQTVQIGVAIVAIEDVLLHNQAEILRQHSAEHSVKG